MLFSEHPRAHYRKSPLREVICQLRFPTILSINQTEPAAFQELIRGQFPQYARRQDQPAPRVTGLGTPNPKVEQLPPVNNYHFLSEDTRWKLNLTQEFLALSTLSYPGWESFARVLDQALASFISIYQPAFFQRVGLRYVNVISRKELGVESTPWTELLQPAYCGPLSQEDLAEDRLTGTSCDWQIRLDSSSQAKIHTGIGMLKPPRPDLPQDPEVKCVLDIDLSMGGNTPCTLSAGALETLHGHSTRLFEGAVTEQLRSVMDPE